MRLANSQFRLLFVWILILFFIFPCRYSLGAQIISEYPFRYEYITLLPLSSWKQSGGITVDKDGRIYLTADGKGSLEYRLSLNVDEYPYLMLRMADSKPGPVWSVRIDKTDEMFSPGSTLIETKEEGEFLLPLGKEKHWSGSLDLRILLSIEGRKGDWILFDHLKVLKLDDKPPPAPTLGAPIQDIEVRTFAVHFIWKQVPNAVSYEIQFSKPSDFSRPQSKVINTPFIADKLLYLPEKGFEEGRWYWRVRGRNKNQQAGDWSATRIFRASDEFAPRPTERQISSYRPLVILFSDPEGLEKNWESLPDVFKSSTYLRVEALPSERLRNICEVAEKRDIPILIQVSGPHDFYGETSSRISLSEIEDVFQNFKMVKGAFICEQACQYEGLKNLAVASYATRLIKLAAHYGKLVVWADGHWGRYHWLDLYKNRELISTVKTFNGNIVLVWKMNCGLTPYTIPGALLGLWLSDVVQDWGIEPESWYWFEAGFKGENEQLGFKEGATASMPPSFYGQMLLLGITHGATTYIIEPNSDIWERPGIFGHKWKKTIEPILLNVLRERFIVSKDSVREQSRRTLLLKRDVQWDPSYGELLPVIKTAYQPRSPFDIIPKGPSSFVPFFVNEKTIDTISWGKRFSKVIETESFTYLVRKGAAEDQFSIDHAWSTRNGDFNFVMNSNENIGSEQHYEVPLRGGFKNISGRVGLNSYLLIHQLDDKTIDIIANGREGKSFTMDVTLREGRLRLEPASAPKELTAGVSGVQGRQAKISYTFNEGFQATLQFRLLVESDENK